MKRDLRDHTPRSGAGRALGGKKAEPTWVKQEKRLAKSSGGRRQPASGATEFLKGDVKAGDLLIEAKATDAASLSVKLAWLSKITEQARAVGKVPALAVTFADTPFGVERDWILLPKTLIFPDGG
jgi:Holliday junction resolvase